MFRFGVMGLVLVAACGEDTAKPAIDAAPEAAIDAASDADNGVRSLTLIGPIGPIATWACAPLALGIVDSSGAAAPLIAPASVTAATSSGTGKLYATAEDCWTNSATTAVQLASGATRTTIYYRAVVGETATITLRSSIGSPVASVISVELEVLGQPDTSTVTAYADRVGGIDMIAAGGRLITVGDGWHRVLVLNTAPTAPIVRADLVLGQPSLSTVSRRPISGSTLFSPRGAWTDGTRFFVADTENNRVLVWNQFPTTNGQGADFALGQPPGAGNLTSDDQTRPVAERMHRPSAITSDGTRLYVADSGFGRVLVWNTLPTSAGQRPDLVIGRPNLDTTNQTGDLTKELDEPKKLAIINGALYVTDGSRVVVWSSIPSTNGAAASYALGQPAGPNNLTTAAAGCAADRVTLPGRVATDGTRLFLPDGLRVLVWNTIPTVGGTPADYALGVAAGPANLTSCAFTGVIDSVQFAGVAAVVASAGKLLVQEAFRILVWNAAPTMPGTPADFAVDRPPGANNLLGSSSPEDTTGSTIQPTTIVTDGVRTFAVDQYRSRILVWQGTPTNGQPAAFALGQAPGAANLQSWGANVGGRGGSTLYWPKGAYSDGTRLFVADSGNNRVLVWNTMPTNAGQPADFALGQPPGADNLTGDSPTGWSGDSIASDGTRLFIAGGNRVLVWNTIPTSPTAPDFVLGGPSSMVTGTSMAGPVAVGVAGGKLCVADPGNHRVLVWNTIPTAAGTPASFALGQPAGAANLTSSGYAGTPSGEAFAMPVACSGRSRLYVADANNHRVLVWPNVPSSPVPATQVIGQPDLTSGAENRGEAVSRRTLWGPTGVWDEGGRVLISDQYNNRILMVPAY